MLRQFQITGLLYLNIKFEHPKTSKYFMYLLLFMSHDFCLNILRKNYKDNF